MNGEIKKMIKIGSPLFILRDECNNDLMVVIERLAEIGFDGIEFLGLFGYEPGDIRKKLDSCGIVAIGDHVNFYEFVNETDRVIADRKEIGCSFITISSPGIDGLPGGSKYPETLETINRIGEIVNNAGMTLLYHNHAEEARTILSGKMVLEHIADDTDAAFLSLELDLGWIGIAEADPEYFLQKYKNRCPVVHFKDFAPADNENGFVFRPTGYGVLNNEKLYKITQEYQKKPQWYIMDHDCAYENDIYDELKLSLEFFKNLSSGIK